MEEKTIQKLNTAISVVFIIAAIVLFGVAYKQRSAVKADERGATAGSNAGEEAQAFNDLASMKRLELANDFASWTPDAKVSDEKTRSGIVVVKGEIAKAFLSVKASIGGKPLSKYESVFVKLNDAGGHLFRPKSLPTPETSSTSLLYALEDLQVLPSVPYDESRTPEKADLLALLKDGKTVRLTAFISSLRPALLEELSISYVCAEGSDCSLSLR